MRPGLAFAIGLVSMMYAFDWIRLGRMKWRATLEHEFDIKGQAPPTGELVEIRKAQAG